MTDTQTTLAPHSREAEEAVLGSVLVSADAYYDVAGFLQADDFFIHRHRSVWEAMAGLQERRQTLDYLTLIEELDRAGKLDEVGGAAYITALATAMPTSLHAEAYGHIVEQAAIRRRMLEAANQVAKLAFQEDTALETVIDESQKALQAAGERLLAKDVRPFSQVLGSLYDAVEKRSQQKGVFGVPTGFGELDRLLQGLQPSDLVIVAGRPGMGKTSLLLSAVKHAAQVGKKHVAVFSLEMSAEQLAQRIVAQETGIDTQRLRAGRLADDEWPLFAQAVEALSEACLFIDDTPAISPQQMRTKSRRLHLAYGLDLIVVDYLQLMSGGGGAKGQRSFENRVQEVSFVSRQLKALAKELNVPVLAAAQLSRAVEQRADKHPLLSDLRESGSIEMDADVVAFLYRPEMAEATQLIDVIVAKHRNGPTGTVQLVFQPGLAKFENMAHSRRPAS
ncbi:MAG: replicative DNA helicase [Chloroflexota bacterium]